MASGPTDITEPDPSPNAPRDRFLGRAARRLWRGGVWLCVLTLLTHLTVRDRVPLVSLLFYGSPLEVFGISCLGWSLLGRFLQRSRRACAGLAILGMVLLTVAVFGDWRRGSTEVSGPAHGTVRVLFWNVGRGWFANWDEIATELRRFNADAIALSEATGDEVQDTAFWHRHLPEYSCLPLGDGTVMLARGTIEELESGGLESMGLYRRTGVSLGERRFQLVLTDIDSSLLRSRRRPLSRLGRLMDDWNTEPTLLVGDFNTPPGSVWFNPWRDTWRHAWETVGSGYRPTWPLPFPVLALDHVWGNRHIELVRCFADWTHHSDHRPLVTDFRLRK